MEYRELLNFTKDKKMSEVIQGIVVKIIPSVPVMLSYFCNLKVPLLLFWLVLGVVLAFVVYLALSVFYRKKAYRQSFNEIRSCFYFSLTIMICLGIVIGLQKYDQNKLREKIGDLIVSEQECLFFNSKKLKNGVADFYAQNYSEAAIQLKQHLDDPVVEFYYGLMLYEGRGVQRDEKTGLEHIRSSADKKFFRAMGFMVNWGARNGKMDEIVPYAEMLVLAYPNSERGIGYNETVTNFMTEQYLTYCEVSQNSYELLCVYYMYIRKSYYKLWCVINDRDIALQDMNKQTNNLFYEESALFNAWGLWKLESKTLGKLFMCLNANIRFPNSMDAHLEYALMLVDQQNVRNLNYENIPLDNVGRFSLYLAEQELDKALSIAIEKNWDTSKLHILQLLANILRSTDRADEAQQISIIASTLKQKLHYEELGN